MSKLFRYVSKDNSRKKAIYSLANMKIKGYVVEYGMEGLYWFNSDERMAKNYRDLLVGSEDIHIIEDGKSN